MRYVENQHLIANQWHNKWYMNLKFKNTIKKCMQFDKFPEMMHTAV